MRLINVVVVVIVVVIGSGTVVEMSRPASASQAGKRSTQHQSDQTPLRIDRTTSPLERTATQPVAWLSMIMPSARFLCICREGRRWVNTMFRQLVQSRCYRANNELLRRKRRSASLSPALIPTQPHSVPPLFALFNPTIKVEGFGVTVGRAMALLHVVRHGLRSQELWSLLAALDAYTSAQEKVRLRYLGRLIARSDEGL